MKISIIKKVSHIVQKPVPSRSVTSRSVTKLSELIRRETLSFALGIEMANSIPKNTVYAANLNLQFKIFKFSYLHRNHNMLANRNADF